MLNSFLDKLSNREKFLLLGLAVMLLVVVAFSALSDEDGQSHSIDEEIAKTQVEINEMRRLGANFKAEDSGYKKSVLEPNQVLPEIEKLHKDAAVESFAVNLKDETPVKVGDLLKTTVRLDLNNVPWSMASKFLYLVEENPTYDFFVEKMVLRKRPQPGIYDVSLRIISLSGEKK